MPSNPSHNSKRFGPLLRDLNQAGQAVIAQTGVLLEHLADEEGGLSADQQRRSVNKLARTLASTPTLAQAARILADLNEVLTEKQVDAAVPSVRLALNKMLAASRSLAPDDPWLSELDESSLGASEANEALQQLAERMPQWLYARYGDPTPLPRIELNQLHNALLRVLDSLSRSASVAKKANQLKDQLSEEGKEDPMVLAMGGEQAANLAVEALRGERQAYANYLTAFSTRLQGHQKQLEQCREPVFDAEQVQARFNSAVTDWQEKADNTLAHTPIGRQALSELETIVRQQQQTMRDALSQQQQQLDQLETALRQAQAEASQQRHRADQFQEQARVDALTQLLNLPAFGERLDQEIRRFQRYKQPLTLVLVELDQVQVISKRYGEMAGDRVRQAVGSRLRALVREVDVVARTGADGFALLLPSTPLEGAELVAQRLCKAISALPLRFREDNVQVTLSAGVVAADAAEASDQLMQRAEAAARQAHDAGGNSAQVG